MVGARRQVLASPCGQGQERAPLPPQQRPLFPLAVSTLTQRGRIALSAFGRRHMCLLAPASTAERDPRSQLGLPWREERALWRLLGPRGWGAPLILFGSRADSPFRAALSSVRRPAIFPNSSFGASLLASEAPAPCLAHGARQSLCMWPIRPQPKRFMRNSVAASRVGCAPSCRRRHPLLPTILLG